MRLAPKAPIVMGLERRLSREWDRADEVVLKRALTHAGLIERCVERVDDARAAGTSRRLDYRIRIRAGGTTTTLEGGRDDPTRYGGPPARPAGSVEATEAVITVVDAEGTERTSVIATDVALTTGATRWPEESTVVLARPGRRPTTVELEALLDEALWTPSCDDTVAVREEQERFEDRAHEVATNLLLPRAEAVDAQVRRRCGRLTALRVAGGERLRIEIKGTGDAKQVRTVVERIG